MSPSLIASCFVLPAAPYLHITIVDVVVTDWVITAFMVVVADWVITAVMVVVAVVAAGAASFAGPLLAGPLFLLWVTLTATPKITPTTANAPTTMIASPFFVRYHGVDFDLLTSFE